MAKGHEYVKAGKLLDFSISQMQPWLDVKDGYSSVVAIGEDGEAAAEIAKELAQGLWDMWKICFPKWRNCVLLAQIHAILRWSFILRCLCS